MRMFIRKITVHTNPVVICPYLHTICCVQKLPTQGRFALNGTFFWFQSTTGKQNIEVTIVSYSPCGTRESTRSMYRFMNFEMGLRWWQNVENTKTSKHPMQIYANNSISTSSVLSRRKYLNFASMIYNLSGFHIIYGDYTLIHWLLGQVWRGYAPDR